VCWFRPKLEDFTATRMSSDSCRRRNPRSNFANSAKTCGMLQTPYESIPSCNSAAPCYGRTRDACCSLLISLGRETLPQSGGNLGHQYKSMKADAILISSSTQIWADQGSSTLKDIEMLFLRIRTQLYGSYHMSSFNTDHASSCQHVKGARGRIQS
jgi:hypothetical protein